MAKALVQVGFATYVMDADVAVTVAKALADAEEYERVYVSSENAADGKSHYAYYIWNRDNAENNVRVEFLGDSLYKIAKLAGKPAGKR